MDLKLVVFGIRIEIDRLVLFRVVPPYTRRAETETRALDFSVHSERPPRVYVRVEGDPFEDPWVHSLGNDKHMAFN